VRRESLVKELKSFTYIQTYMHTHTHTCAVRRESLGKELSNFGGVIFVKAGNDKINSIQDLKGK
jgi:hypothetical protein